MHSIGPEGIVLPKTRDSRYNLHLKREVIGKFLFNMAFENSMEPGYVTEKPFDALMSGICDSKYCTFICFGAFLFWITLYLLNFTLLYGLF